MRTHIVTVVSLLLLAGCSDPKITSIGGITEEEFDGLVEPVPGSEPADYRAKERTLRLFGVQGDPAFATVADTASWQTWNLRIDDTLGRGLRAESIASGITLANATGSALSLLPGADVRLRTITHRLDDAAVYAGRQTWRVKPASMTELREMHGRGAEAAMRLDLFPVPAVELVSVDPDGVLAHLGFRTGDFLFELDGVALDAAKLDDLVARAEGAAPFTVSMYRAGAPGTRTFVPE